jgi:hypothetical protein
MVDSGDKKKALIRLMERHAPHLSWVMLFRGFVFFDMIMTSELTDGRGRKAATAINQESGSKPVV